jgi:hypothetical protein
MAHSKQADGLVTFDLRTVPPMKELQFKLSRWTELISDWDPLMHLYGDRFKRQMVEQFATQGEMSGERWADTDPVYTAWKLAHYGTSRVGVRSEALLSSMTGGGGYSEIIERTWASFGMSVNSLAKGYGSYFAEKRPVIRMTERWARQYQKDAHEWLNTEAHHAGFTGAGSRIYNSPLSDLSYTESLPVD